MAKFELAYKYTANIEHGYTIDNGGITYRGVAFQFWQDDAIAKQIEAIVKAYKPKRGEIINNPKLESLVISFYKNNFWDKIKGDQISNQTLANFVYDFSVNTGSGIVLMNKALSGKAGSNILPETLQVLNAKPSASYAAIKAVRKNLYDRLAKKSQALKNNYTGWIARLNSFPQTLTA
jgi:lysozyme family protein